MPDPRACEALQRVWDVTHAKVPSAAEAMETFGTMRAHALLGPSAGLFWLHSRSERSRLLCCSVHCIAYQAQQMPPVL